MAIAHTAKRASTAAATVRMVFLRGTTTPSAQMVVAAARLARVMRMSPMLKNSAFPLARRTRISGKRNADQSAAKEVRYGRHDLKFTRGEAPSAAAFECGLG